MWRKTSIKNMNTDDFIVDVCETENNAAVKMNKPKLPTWTLNKKIIIYNEKTDFLLSYNY